jgi:hypothetical protein
MMENDTCVDGDKRDDSGNEMKVPRIRGNDCMRPICELLLNEDDAIFIQWLGAHEHLWSAGN